MPYADSDGVSIHYELEGAGAPLVLQHGFTDSLQTWYDLGYVDALKSDNQLILVDARGHGASGRPRDPEAYKPDRNASDIAVVLDDLSIDRAHFYGYSMGAMIAYAMARYAPERVRTLIIGGGSPTPPPQQDDPQLAALRGGAEAIPDLWGVPLPQRLKARLLANDAEALIANRIAVLGRPSFAPMLPQMRVPCLLYAGEADGAYAASKDAAAQIPNAAFFFLPGLGHVDAFLRSDLVLPHVIDFLHRASG